MKNLFTLVTVFIGRHWLRLAIVTLTLFLLSRKQINLSVRLGSPAQTPALTATTPPEGVAPPGRESEEAAGFLSRFSLFGSTEKPSHYDLLSRMGEAEVEAFLRRFANVAQAEQDKFGIPASITLANSLLFSVAGTNEAARTYNSFFGLACTTDWPGPTGRADQGCVRSYESAWTSFRDHSLFVTSKQYATLRQLSETDYRQWAAGLEKLNYNDTEDLARQLVRTVDKYQLFRYD